MMMVVTISVVSNPLITDMRFFTKYVEDRKGLRHNNTKRIFDEVCRGEEGRGHQNEERIFD